jgi:hypothetical protein
MQALQYKDNHAMCTDWLMLQLACVAGTINHHYHTLFPCYITAVLQQFTIVHCEYLQVLAVLLKYVLDRRCP